MYNPNNTSNTLNKIINKRILIIDEHFIHCLSKLISNAVIKKNARLIRTPSVFTDLSTKSKLRLNNHRSGEQQLYSKVASLILIEPSDYLILIDEPELSLHPEWQAALITLKKIGSNN